MTQQQQSQSPEFLKNVSRLNTLRIAVQVLGEAFSLHEGHQKARLYSQESAAKLIAADEDAIDALIREERTAAHSYSPVREAEAILAATDSYSPVREAEAILAATPNSFVDEFEAEHKQLLRDNQLSQDELLEIEHRQFLKDSYAAVDAAHEGEGK
jgi:hypothetical protein